MPTEDDMTVTERRKYLKKRKPLYLRADRADQSRLLTEMQQVTELHRKSLIGCCMRTLWTAKSARKAEDGPMG
jgi:hypothetical protein